MSRATNQARVLIATACGALINIRDLDLNRAQVNRIHKAIVFGGSVLQEYPETGNSWKNDTWCKEMIHSIDPLLEELDDIYNYKTMIWLAHLAVIDVLSKIRDPIKVRHVTKFKDAIDEVAAEEVFGQEVGPEYDLANGILSALQRNMGF